MATFTYAAVTTRHHPSPPPVTTTRDTTVLLAWCCFVVVTEFTQVRAPTNAPTTRRFIPSFYPSFYSRSPPRRRSRPRFTRRRTSGRWSSRSTPTPPSSCTRQPSWTCASTPSLGAGTLLASLALAAYRPRASRATSPSPPLLADRRWPPHLPARCSRSVPLLRLFRLKVLRSQPVRAAAAHLRTCRGRVPLAHLVQQGPVHHDFRRGACVTCARHVVNPSLPLLRLTPRSSCGWHTAHSAAGVPRSRMTPAPLPSLPLTRILPPTAHHSPRTHTLYLFRSRDRV